MAEHIMTGAELASMLKGQLQNNMKFNGIIGADDPELHLSEEDIKWWRDSKLGLFVHWGVYSVIGRGEWTYFVDKFSEEDYRNIAETQFHPQYSPEEITQEWIRHAQNAGMKYAVMVTRHHDGFAMWDSKASWKDYTSANCGPKADYVKAFTDACHNAGLHTGLYYSPMDWRFPGYFNPTGEAESAALMKKQAHEQLRELCSQYGDVEILWYDGGWLAHTGTDADAAEFWDAIELNKGLRALQPNIMFTPRSGYRGDFECDEGPHEVKGGIVPIPWEKCFSVSSVWGYCPNDKYHSASDIIRIFVDTVCRDGNMLLNVGPDANGLFPPKAQAALEGIGKWMKENGESIYGTRAGIWNPIDNVYGSTYKDDLIFLHILDCEKFNEMTLSPIEQTIESAALLNGEPIEFTQTEQGIRIHLHEHLIKEKRLDTIIKLKIKG